MRAAMERKMFLCEQETFYKLMTELYKPCDCQGLSHKITSVSQVGLSLTMWLITSYKSIML